MSQRPQTKNYPDLVTRYGQAFIVSFTPMEFSLELGLLDTTSSVRNIHTHIIMSPQKFRDFLDTCEKTWADYDKKFGILDKKKKPREK